eukprot:Rmarinus@m.1151
MPDWLAQSVVSQLEDAVIKLTEKVESLQLERDTLRLTCDSLRKQLDETSQERNVLSQKLNSGNLCKGTCAPCTQLRNEVDGLREDKIEILRKQEAVVAERNALRAKVKALDVEWQWPLANGGESDSERLTPNGTSLSGGRRTEDGVVGSHRDSAGDAAAAEGEWGHGGGKTERKSLRRGKRDDHDTVEELPGVGVANGNGNGNGTDGSEDESSGRDARAHGGKQPKKEEEHSPQRRKKVYEGITRAHVFPSPTVSPRSRRRDGERVSSAGPVSIARPAKHKDEEITVEGSFKGERVEMARRNPLGGRDMNDIVKQCYHRAEPWVDQDFPHDARSLFVDPQHPPHDWLREGERGESLQNTEIAWLRPHKFCATPGPEGWSSAEKGRRRSYLYAHEKGSTTDDAEGIDPEDVTQGSLGDCYFLAAVSAVVQDRRLRKDIIDEVFEEFGVYGVTFFVNGRWTMVWVDSAFPCRRSRSGSWVPVYAYSKGLKEIWVMVIEKAFAKLHGSYEALDGGLAGDAMAYLTGACMQIFDLKSPGLQSLLSSGEAWQMLLEDIRSAVKFVTAGVGADCPIVDENQDGHADLVHGHAYTVLDAKEVGSFRLVRLCNPWGRFEWQGDWSDGSPLWRQHPDVTAAVGGVVHDDDGSFWMSFEDFVKFFSRYSTATNYPSDWILTTIQGLWKPGLTAGGFPTEGPERHANPAWVYNPRYKLSAERATGARGDFDIVITLFQQDMRRPEVDPVVLQLCILDERGAEEPHSLKEEFITVCAVEGSQRQVSVEVTLRPGGPPIVIMPMQRTCGAEYPFSLSVISEWPIDVHPLAPRRVPHTMARAMAYTPHPRAFDCYFCGRGPVPSKGRDPNTGYYEQCSFRGARCHFVCLRCKACGGSLRAGLEERNGVLLCPACYAGLRCANCACVLDQYYYPAPRGGKLCPSCYTLVSRRHVIEP